MRRIEQQRGARLVGDAGEVLEVGMRSPLVVERRVLLAREHQAD